MRFTKYNSLNEILAYPRMAEYLHVFYSDYLLEMFPRELYGEPVALVEQFAKTPWEEPFSVIADQLIDTANLILEICEDKTRRCISLWEEEEGDWSLEKEKQGGKSSVFLLAPKANEKKSSEKRPAVIICPGGGYEAVCFSGEGTPVLRILEARGCGVFILKYRVAPERYPAPQEDLALAIRYVRAHAEEYGIDGENVLLIGASAGGHLCASEAALYKELEESGALPARYDAYSARPDRLCLSYPVISFAREPHEGSFQALTGGAEDMRERLSAENLVTEHYPSSFVWTCADDDCVPPSNAVRMGEALKENGVPYRMNLYPAGGHGCGLAYTKSAYRWSRDMIDFFGL